MAKVSAPARVLQLLQRQHHKSLGRHPTNRHMAFCIFAPYPAGVTDENIEIVFDELNGMATAEGQGSTTCVSLVRLIDVG